MKEPDIHVRCINISANFSGQRIDNFLFVYFKKVPKSVIYRMIRIGAVRVNKKRIQFRYKLKIGDVLKLPIIKTRKINILNMQFFSTKIEFLHNIIIYEDDYLLALNKPSGIAVHGGSGLQFGVIEGLRALRPEAPFLELVHRLDRATSGILLLAKQRTALVCLHEQLRIKKVQKEYLALVEGAWNVNIKKISIPLIKKNVILSDLIGIIPKNLKIEKSATTYFFIKERFGDIATLLIVKPITGKTHQIRIHTAYVNHPIIGDDTYGNYSLNIKFKEYGCNRLFLHACSLSFYHPNTKELLQVQAPLDHSLDRCLCYLRNLIRTDRNNINNNYR